MMFLVFYTLFFLNFFKNYLFFLKLPWNHCPFSSAITYSFCKLCNFLKYGFYFSMQEIYLMDYYTHHPKKSYISFYHLENKNNLCCFLRRVYTVFISRI